MGPWFIRDPARPFAPGCSYQVLVALARRGRITPETVIRGPTTLQFWVRAARVPALAHHLGICHSCQEVAAPDQLECPHCGASFEHRPDRHHLGLGPVHELPASPAPMHRPPHPHSDPPEDPESIPRTGRSGAGPRAIALLLLVGVALGAAAGAAVLFSLSDSREPARISRSSPPASPPDARAPDADPEGGGGEPALAAVESSPPNEASVPTSAASAPSEGDPPTSDDGAFERRRALQLRLRNYL